MRVYLLLIDLCEYNIPALSSERCTDCRTCGYPSQACRRSLYTLNASGSGVAESKKQVKEL